MEEPSKEVNVKDDPGPPIRSPDGGWGWMVMFSFFMNVVLLDGVVSTFGIFVPGFLSYFGESNGKTQMLHSILSGMIHLIAPIASVLVNKYGCRSMAIIGAILTSIGLFLSTFSPTLDVMFLFYSFFGGAGFGLMYLAGIVIISFYFNKHRAFATGIALSGAGVGGLVFAPLNQYLLETYGWHGTMWIISAVFLHGVVFAAAYRPLMKKFDSNTGNMMNINDKVDADVDVEKQFNTHCQQFCSSLQVMFDFNLLKSPTMILFGVSSFLCQLGYYIPLNFLPIFASDANLSADDGALLILSIGISNAATRLLVGYVTDQPWGNSLLINNAVLVVGGLVTCFVPYFTTFYSLVIYSALFGCVMATFMCLRSILITELLGVQRLTSSFGLVGLCMGLATVIGSPIAGVLTDVTGEYNIAFYFGGVTLVVGGVACFPLRRISMWEQSKSYSMNGSTGCNSILKQETNIELTNVKQIPSMIRTAIFTVSDN